MINHSYQLVLSSFLFFSLRFFAVLDLVTCPLAANRPPPQHPTFAPPPPSPPAAFPPQAPMEAPTRPHTARLNPEAEPFAPSSASGPHNLSGDSNSTGSAAAGQAVRLLQHHAATSSNSASSSSKSLFDSVAPTYAAASSSRAQVPLRNSTLSSGPPRPKAKGKGGGSRSSKDKALSSGGSYRPATGPQTARIEAPRYTAAGYASVDDLRRACLAYVVASAPALDVDFFLDPEKNAQAAFTKDYHQAVVTQLPLVRLLLCP